MEYIAKKYCFKETDGTTTIVEQDTILRAIEDFIWEMDHPVLEVFVEEVSPAHWHLVITDDEAVSTTYTVEVME